MRKLTAQELIGEIALAKSQIVQLKSETTMHRIKNWQLLVQAKKNLARLLTINQEQQIIKSLPHEQS